MKKAICLSLVATLLLLVCVYTSFYTDRENKNRNYVPPNPTFCVLYEMLGFTDSAEYQEYMRHAPIMPAFVTYEMLGALGDVQYALVLEEYWNRKNFKITDCYYSFREDDKEGTDYSISAYVKPLLEDYKDEASFHIDEPYRQIYHYTEDLRKSESDGYCVLELKDVQYRYIDGELRSIQWETPSNVFKLSIDEADKVGREAGTLLSYMLYSRTSVLAITALSTTIELCLLFQKLRCVTWIVAIPWFLLGMLQLLNIPPVRSKKVKRIEDIQLQRKYRRGCGITKLIVAAVFAGITLMGLREPIAMLICTVLAVALLVLAVKQQRWLDKKYLPQAAAVQSEPS